MICEEKSSAWLSNQLLRCSDQLLVVDVRQRGEFDRGHIVGAINLSCTSELILRRVKRGNFSLDRLLHTETEKARFALSGESTVIVYDSVPSPQGEIMSVLCNRLASRCRYLCTLQGECPMKLLSKGSIDFLRFPFNQIDGSETNQG